jgi:uncharacterized protein YbjT (DUF2867 family)
MSQPILITGAAGGRQGLTGRLVAELLLRQNIPVRAFVHTLDARSEALRLQGAEVVEGDLLNPASVLAAAKGVKRAYFTYPVADGLLEAAAIFAASVREIFTTLGKAIGRPLRYVPITDDQWTAALQERINPHALAHLSSLWRYFRTTDQLYRPTDTVRATTGRDPQTLEQFFGANAAAFAGSAVQSQSTAPATVPAGGNRS